MKTPKRERYNMLDIFAEPEKIDAQCARWKRKNRVRQLKNTIARLTAENKWLSEERLKYINYHTNALMTLAELREDILQQRKERE